MKNLINHWMLRSFAVVLLVLFGTSFNSKAGGSIATPTNVTISGGGTFCAASTTPLTTAITWGVCSGAGGTTNAPIATYSWYSNTVNSNSGGTLVGTTATYNAPISTAGTLYYYCVITWNDPDGGSACSAGSFTSSTGTVTVNEVPTTANAGSDQNLAACATTTTLAGNTPVSGTGTWTCVSGCTGVTITSPNSPTSGVTGLVPGTNTTFQWTIANAPCTASTDQVIVNTLVGPMCPTYCTPTETQSSAAGHISNVSFNTISNSSGFSPGGYSNNSVCATMAAGNTYTLSVTGTSIVGASNYLTAFIDYNADGDFADAGESIVLSSTWNGSVSNTNITIPGTASCGATIRFRLIFEYASATTTTEAQCGATSSAYGETEDYCLTITCNTPTCDDGIKNQDETGVDCGGATCPPCVDACHDGIQNSDETGVDCGGAFCLPCTTNGTTTPSTACCQATAQAAVYPTVCPQVGTSAYNLNSPVVEFTSQNTTGCLPGVASGCGAYSTLGSWAHISLEDGVDQLQMAWAQGAGDGINTGNSTVWGAVFQGTGCGSLTYVDCQELVSFISGAYGVFQAQFSGLDPNQDVWIYTWNDNGKSYNMDFQFIGVNQQPSNTSCATAEAALDQGCNLGATGASFTTPAAGGVACSGGNWGSNENTTFYSFTADDVTGSLEIDNITCNDGESGQAQFAVWTSCAGIGTYGVGSGFLGCAVGTAAISLSPLTPGQTYYIAVDGYAGDNCVYGFTGTGIILPVQFWYLDAAYEGKVVNVNWGSLSESNCSHYIVQRTQDGRSYTDLGTVSGNGTTKEENEYMFVDYSPLVGTSYYRLKQVDFDGNHKYSEIRVVKSAKDNAVVLRTYNLMGQQVGPEYKGVVIDYYSDGTAIKRIQE